MWLNVSPKILKLALGIKVHFVILQDQIFKPGVILIIQAHKYVLQQMDRLASNLLLGGIWL
jgi:hypothetical protein